MITSPESVYYFFKGHWYAFVRRQYEGHFEHEDKLEEMFRIAASCPGCTLDGVRKCCGCPSFESILSLKKTCKQ